jgi:electron transfer flavoprotein beta subunit
MNIVVAMKQVPDLSQIRIRKRQPVFDEPNYTFGSLDKNALEAAVQLKESSGGKVIVLAVGSAELENTVKEALAAGGDEAFLFADDEFADLDGSQTANLLAAGIRKLEDVGLVLFGEGSGDNYSGQVFGRVGELLGWPQAGYARSVRLEGNSVIVERSLEDCVETVKMAVPAIVSTVAEINQIPIPTVPQILKAGKKPKETLDATDLENKILPASVKVLSSLAPENERKGVRLKSAAELVSALKAENLL